MQAIPTDQHVFIAGKTGSGKSFLAEVYLAGYDHVIMLDTKGQSLERRKKGENLWDGLKEGKDFVLVETLEEVAEARTKKIIYCPIPEEQDEEHYDALMKWVYERENTILWIDELMQVCPSPSKYPYHMKHLYQRGRFVDSVVWACTQRPATIPSDIMSNSTHFFIFDLNKVADRKRVADDLGSDMFMDKPGYRNFWYMRDSDDEPVRATLKL
ncbi:ATP-binding protein [Bacillus paranthracis]|uniref:ATP-binding protein n=1 Tax=Bacillus paranthracis TaxID=2026186 RepID=UPI002E1F61D8|nr:ATP-binding protein [Bacillus paranthracis]